MNDPWAFGWTQALTIIGFIITVTIAVTGFRTFDRWKREKIEEKRIDLAIEALALVYEARFIFEHIRSSMAFPAEWADMPKVSGKPDDDGARGSFYATLKRIEANKEFFERAWKLQVRCAALFGPKIEDSFILLQRARREVEVSAGMLYRDPYPQHKSEDNLKTWESWRQDVWQALAEHSKDGDRVGKKLEQFKTEIEAVCRPIVDREFGKVERTSPTTVGNLHGVFYIFGVIYVSIGALHSVFFSLFVTRTQCALSTKGLVYLFCHTGIGISHLVTTLAWPWYWVSS